MKEENEGQLYIAKDRKRKEALQTKMQTNTITRTILRDYYKYSLPIFYRCCFVGQMVQEINEE